MQDKYNYRPKGQLSARNIAAAAGFTGYCIEKQKIESPGFFKGLICSSDSCHFVGDTGHGMIFPHCGGVIHHGGAGTTQTTLLCQVPCVVVPHIADQFLWASEMHRLGLHTLEFQKLAFMAGKDFLFHASTAQGLLKNLR